MRRWVRQGARPSGFVVVSAIAATNACIPQLSDLRSDAGPPQTEHVSVIDSHVLQAFDAGGHSFSTSGGGSDGVSSLGAVTTSMTDAASTADTGSSSGVSETPSANSIDAGSSASSLATSPASSADGAPACSAGTRPCVDCSAEVSGDAGECIPCESGGYCAGGTADFVVCAPGTWDDDGRADTLCRAMTDCLPGQYVSVAGDPVTNRSCEFCPASTFSDVVNSSQCQAWSTCLAPGVYEVAAPDAAHDRQCEECGPLSISLENNAQVCIGLAYGMSGGQVAFEAEHYHVVNNTDSDEWTNLDLVEVSGDRCLEIGPDDKSDWTVDPFENAPRLDYLVQFDTVGTFYVHVRGDAGASSEGYSDSCYAAIDGVTTDWYRFEILGGTWGWSSQPLDVTTTGVHVVSIMAREDGFRVDKVVVSTSATSPTGDGPEESSRVPITP